MPGVAPNHFGLRQRSRIEEEALLKRMLRALLGFEAMIFLNGSGTVQVQRK